MKILHIDFAFIQGGIHNMLCDIMKVQCRMGHDVSLLVINDTIQEEVLCNIPKEVKVYYVHRSEGSKNPFYLLKTEFLVNCVIKPDILHAHNDKVVNLLPFRKCPMIVTVHAMGFDPGRYRKFDYVVAISDAVKEEALSYGLNNFNITTIHNGIDFNSVKSRELQQNINELKLVCVGRYDYKIKGQDILIEAVKIIKEVYKKKVSLDLIGGGKQKDTEYLEHLIDRYSLSEEVSLSGSKNKRWIYDNLCNYNLFVCPSRHEGFGLAIIEANAAGLPILASDVDGILNVLDNGELGCLFKSEDAEDLAKKVIRISESSLSDLQNSVEKVRIKFEKQYGIENTVLQYIELYNLLIHKKQ